MASLAVLVGCLWFSTSAFFSTFANGLFLSRFSDPFGFIFVRFASASAVSLVLAFAAPGQKVLRKWSTLARQLLAPAALLLGANLLNAMGIQRTGVTVTYVVKSMIPFFTVLFCRLRGQTFEGNVYVTLVPLCLGVALASFSDLSFDGSGMLCALGSALAQTLLNITSKEKIHALGLSGMEAFWVMTSVCAVLSVPLLVVSCAQEGGFLGLAIDPVVTETSPLSLRLAMQWPVLLVVVLEASAYYLEYTLNFVFVSLCSPLAFSVTDITRRLGTICFGAVVWSKCLTATNLLGVAMALLGALSYSVISRSDKGRRGKNPYKPQQMLLAQSRSIKIVETKQVTAPCESSHQENMA